MKGCPCPGRREKGCDTRPWLLGSIWVQVWQRYGKVEPAATRSSWSCKATAITAAWWEQVGPTKHPGTDAAGNLATTRAAHTTLHSFTTPAMDADKHLCALELGDVSIRHSSYINLRCQR